MTDKQYVLNVYPTAKSQRIKRKRYPCKLTEIVYRNYEPFPWPFDSLPAPEWRRLSDGCDTASKAWRDAWARIQSRMLEKMES